MTAHGGIAAGDDAATGERPIVRVPPVEPFFAVLFECGGHLSFQCPKDALDCMNKHGGAYATIRLPGKVLVGVPMPFGYSQLWRLRRDPDWVSQ